MKWDDFNPNADYEHNQYEPTNIECPECGEKIYRFVGIVLATYPPQYRYECKKCGWSGTK